MDKFLLMLYPKLAEQRKQLADALRKYRAATQAYYAKMHEQKHKCMVVEEFDKCVVGGKEGCSRVQWAMCEMSRLFDDINDWLGIVNDLREKIDNLLWNEKINYKR